MAIAKKQFEVQVNARIVATDPTGTLTAANLTPIVDSFAINGVEIALSALTLGSLAADIKTVVDTYKSIT